MKPYSEQIAAIKEAIKYKEHECSLLQDIVTQRAEQTSVEAVVRALSKKQRECTALQDAASTIIAVERDEKLFLAASDMLEALEGLSELVSMSYAEYAKANIKAKKAIAKAKEGATV